MYFFTDDALPATTSNTVYHFFYTFCSFIVLIKGAAVEEPAVDKAINLSAY